MAIENRAHNDEAASKWPDRMVSGETPVVLRLWPSQMPEIRSGDVLRVVTVGHSVYEHQPNALLEDLVTAADMADEALVAVARANPEVPVRALKRAAVIFAEHDVPYFAEGYRTLAKWEVSVTFTPRPSVNELELQVYDVEFFPSTGKVSAEWTLTLDLDRGEVRDLVVYEIAPEPEPDPGE